MAREKFMVDKVGVSISSGGGQGQSYTMSVSTDACHGTPCSFCSTVELTNTQNPFDSSDVGSMHEVEARMRRYFSWNGWDAIWFQSEVELTQTPCLPHHRHLHRPHYRHLHRPHYRRRHRRRRHRRRRHRRHRRRRYRRRRHRRRRHRRRQAPSVTRTYACTAEGRPTFAGTTRRTSTCCAIAGCT